MNRVALALAALAALVGGPASAQFYYEQEPYDAYEERYEYRGPPPRYRTGPPRFHDPYERYTPRHNYRRARIGSVCVTSRGNCDAGDAFPVNTPCRCYIPGFGAKRGAIGF